MSRVYIYIYVYMTKVLKHNDLVSWFKHLFYVLDMDFHFNYLFFSPGYCFWPEGPREIDGSRSLEFLHLKNPFRKIENPFRQFANLREVDFTTLGKAPQRYRYLIGSTVRHGYLICMYSRYNSYIIHHYYANIAAQFCHDSTYIFSFKY